MDDGQYELERLVRNFNQDYMALLGRAAEGDYRGLVASFSALKDLYDALILLLDGAAAVCPIALLPFSIQGNDTLLREWEFDDGQLVLINRFLEQFLQERGVSFEQAMHSQRREE